MAGSNSLTRIGITGHRNLSPRTVDLVEQALAALVADQHGAELVGITCLAEGADRLFTRAVLNHGGTIEAIIPCHGYRERMTAEAQLEYDQLLARARRVTQLPYPEPKGAAYLAASLVLVERSDLLVAVLDETSPPSFAGTADVVAYARQVGVPVRIVWPPGSERL